MLYLILKKSAMYRTIIFDLGGVLFDWDPAYLYRKIFRDEAEMAFFLNEVCHAEWNEQQDAGRPVAEAVAEKIAEYPEYEKAIRAYYGRWREMLAGPMEGTLELLRSLYQREEHQLYALTNWSQETFPIAWEQYSFLRWFEGIVVSGREGLKKPDPRIYELTLERYRIDRSSALFIDDNEQNVEAAEQLGLPALHFHSPEQLKSEFARLNI